MPESFLKTWFFISFVLLLQQVKKIVFVVFVGVSIIIGVWAYLTLKNNKKPKVDAISVLPDSCSVYINTHDFFELSRKINSQSLIADKLKLLESIGQAFENIQTFDSLFKSYDLVNEQIADNLLHMAFYGKNSDWMISFNIKQLGSQNAINEAFVKILNAKTNENGNFNFELAQNEQIYFLFKSGVAVFSNSQKLLQLSKENDYPKFKDSNSYKEFKNTLTENDLCSIYINHQLYSRSRLPSNLNLTVICKKGISVAEVDVQPSELRINGYLSADSSEVLSALANQKPQSSEEIISLLPYNTVSFEAFGFHSFVELKSNLFKYKKNENTAFWKEMNELALYNLDRDFSDNINKGLVSFKTRLSDQEIICAPVGDTLKAFEHLTFMSDTLLTKTPAKIFQLKATKGVNRLFQPLFNTPLRFACVFQSCLFFAQTLEELEEALTSIINKQYLNANDSYLNYKNEHFVDEYNYLFYCAPDQLQEEALRNFFNLKNSSKKNPIENLSHFCYSITNGANNFKFRLQLQHKASGNNLEKNSLWTINMDTVCRMSPFAFINHNTQENELVLQDEGRNLYLLNAKGSILWKRKLNEKIVGSIQMVDAFKNNKHQLLFNSKNYLHLIDRNGNYVEGYPVKLPAEASSELTIFDYENNRDYRIFVSCKDNTIYDYSITGNKQEGFAPVKTENEVNLPLQYAKVGLSDYLIALDKEGKIYTFGRKGQGRIGLKNRTIANCPAFYVDATNNINTTYIAYLDDKSALINKISFSDRKEIIKVDQETQNAAVSFGLIDENRGMDFIVTKDNTIMSYDLNGDLLFKKELKGNLGKTGFYSDESHSLFYSLNADDKELVIYDLLKQNTSVLKTNAMPLISKLFKDNKKYLILTYDNLLNCVPLD